MRFIRPKLNILDCTLRDGGYYNNWFFEDHVVKKYINALNSSQIEYVEIGFRSLKKNGLGPFSYTTDKLLTKLNINKNCKIAIMIDTKEILDSKIGIKKTLNLLLNDHKNSKVNLIRFATHFKDIDKLEEIINMTKKMGYLIAINLMQCGGKNENEINDAVKLLASFRKIEVLYFADSLGNMMPKEVIRIIKIIKKNWKNQIGIHAHNNQGKAIDNCIAAIDNGVTWVDSTISGMGRGAGNAETEILLPEIKEKYKKNYNIKQIYHLAVNEFQELKEKCKWGQNLFYYLAAKNNIHPTYIQEMLTDDRYTKNNILKTINHIKNIPSTSYNKDLLNEIYIKEIKKNNKKNNKKRWDLLNWCFQKKILIIGGGPNINKYLNEIDKFIKEQKPIVLILNYHSKFINKVDGMVVADKSRYLMDSVNYRFFKKFIYIPKDIYFDDPNHKVFKRKIRDFSCKITHGKFKFTKSQYSMPNNLAFSYALTLCNIGKAKNIYLAGFDGYINNNYLHNEMLDTLRFYKNLKKKIDILTITPSLYPIDNYSFLDE